MKGGGHADYASGSGTDTLAFKTDDHSPLKAIDWNGGTIIASEASANVRLSSLKLPNPGLP